VSPDGTERIYSAATSLPKPTSKPDPAIYLHSMKVLGKKTEECVAIEDSKSGTMSGARAGITVVGYVGSYEKHEQDEMIKKLKEVGAGFVMKDWSEFDAVLAKIQQGQDGKTG